MEGADSDQEHTGTTPIRTTPTYSVGNLPSDPQSWPEYQKKVTTRFIRIDGPFEVETSEGKLTCEDGYLGIDARGYPYPVAVNEFALIYEPVQGSTNSRRLRGQV